MKNITTIRDYENKPVAIYGKYDDMIQAGAITQNADSVPSELHNKYIIVFIGYDGYARSMRECDTLEQVQLYTKLYI